MKHQRTRKATKRLVHEALNTNGVKVSSRVTVEIMLGHVLTITKEEHLDGDIASMWKILNHFIDIQPKDRLQLVPFRELTIADHDPFKHMRLCEETRK